MNRLQKTVCVVLALCFSVTNVVSPATAAGATPTSRIAASTPGTATATISWTTNSATNYQAQILIGNVPVKTSPSLGSSVSSYTFTGLEYNVPYKLQVRAFSSSWSPYGLATPSTITPTAAAPASPAQPTAAVIEDKKLKISWTAPSSDGGSPIARYSVQLIKDGQSAGEPVTTQALQVELSTVDTTSSYSATIAAVNEAGMKSDASEASAPVVAKMLAVAVVDNSPTSGGGNTPASGGGGNNSPSSNNPTSGGGNSNQPVAEVPSAPPVAVQTPPNLVSPLPALLPYSKLVKVKSTTSKSTLGSLSKLSIPKGATTSFVIGTTSKKYCSLRGTSVYMFKAGTCAITFTVKTKSGKKTSRTVKLVVR
jgi:hypothetical protein